MSLTAMLVNFYEAITPFQATILLAILILFVFWLYLRDMDVPPGPKGLPFLGYWPFLSENTCHVQLRELSKKYGDVFSFRITGRLYINLGSLKAIREAHLTKSEYFAARFSEDCTLVFMFKDGVAFLNGEPWKVLHKFFLSKFKEYGMNAVKANTEGSIIDTLNETVEELRETKGSPTDISELITMKCMMIIRRIMLNDNGITKEELKELNDLYSEMTKGMTSLSLLLMGPIAKYLIFPFKQSNWTLKRCKEHIDEILANVVNKHKAEYDESQAVNLIDCYFKERDERRKKGDPTAIYFTDRSLISSLSQFVADGVVTLGVFITNFLTTLVEYPHEQDKIYQEILEVIGPDRLPTLEDKSKMPHTNAFISEVIRFTDFLPMVPSLECTKETTIFGHKIPEGAITLMNVFAANRNPEDFENPDEFNPSRYISSPSKPRAELPVLFGIGKRACIGEGFSMIQTFLFLTTIVQNFRLSFPEKTQGSASFSAAERIKICAHPRA